MYICTSPDYNPRHSPISISDTKSEHGFTPVQNSDGPFHTRASDILNLPNDDSDLENDGEVGLINLVGISTDINCTFKLMGCTCLHNPTIFIICPGMNTPMNLAQIIAFFPKVQISHLPSFI